MRKDDVGKDYLTHESLDILDNHDSADAQRYVNRSSVIVAAADSRKLATLHRKHLRNDRKFKGIVSWHSLRSQRKMRVNDSKQQLINQDLFQLDNNLAIDSSIAIDRSQIQLSDVG